jgi:hypothetical protein
MSSNLFPDPNNASLWNYPGSNVYVPSQGGNAGQVSYVWPPGKQIAALAADQQRQAQIQQLISQLWWAPFFTDVVIPANTANATVTGEYIGQGNPVIITKAQTTRPNNLLTIYANQINNELEYKKLPFLITAFAGQPTNALPFQYLPNPLFVPPTGSVQFSFTDTTGGVQTAGTLSLAGLQLLNDNNPESFAKAQRLWNLLNNTPYWIDLAIRFTGSPADPSASDQFNSIANPVVILGAVTDVQSGTMQISVQTLSGQNLMQDSCRILSFAGNNLSSNPVRPLDAPVIVPPGTNMKATFFQDTLNPQPSGHVTLVGRQLAVGSY